jgi:hypothetical protein
MELSENKGIIVFRVKILALEEEIRVVFGIDPL